MKGMHLNLNAEKIGFVAPLKDLVICNYIINVCAVQLWSIIKKGSLKNQVETEYSVYYFECKSIKV